MNDAVVELLRELLAMAEAGDVIAIGVAMIAPDLSAGSAYRIGDATLTELVGSIELLKHFIMINGKVEVAR